MPRHVHSIAASLLALAPAFAQVPLDHLTVGSFVGTTFSYPGPGGITVVHPSGAPAAAIAPLPTLCTGAGLVVGGCQCVVHLADSGRIVAAGGDFNTTGTALELYVITPTGNLGTTASSVVVHPVGTYSNVNGVGICAMAEIGDGRVLVALDPNSVGGPYAGQTLLIFDPAMPPGPGAFQVVPITGLFPYDVNALAVDVEAQIAYFSVANNQIFAISLPQGGAATFVVATPQIHALAVESDGKLLAGGPQGSFSSSWLWRIDPATAAVTNFPNAGIAAGAVNALHIDPVTGDLFFGFATLSVGGSLQRLSPRAPTGTRTVLTPLPGCIAGIDQNVRLEPYGRASGAAPIARWQLGPNPGGAPMPGNAGFSLTCSPAVGAMYLWAIGYAQTNQSVGTSPPVTLLTQPAAIVLTASNTLPIPIPAAPSLAGVQFYAQCAQLRQNGNVHATSGLRCRL